MSVTPGQMAPPFQLSDQNGHIVSLEEFRGRKVLVYFYPKADTPGCTKQACSVRDSMAELQRAGIVVLGISPDPPAAQSKFDTKYRLGFPLLSDPDHTVAEAYGAWGEKRMYGKSYFGIVRSALLIDERGQVLAAWIPIKPEETVPNALEAIRAD